LKAGDDTGIRLCGGGILAAALLEEIDRLVLQVNPWWSSAVLHC
jgi:hypothetical protein